MAELGTAAVRLEVEEDVALITIDNPPVNALSQTVRQGLAAAIRQVAEDDAIAAAVIIGAGRSFIAGADVREFGQPPQAPSLAEVIAAIEASPKPVAAAIRGFALGGGLEVALGCHYRVAGPDAKLGLPEVSLGIIPGAGGTQRLPRLIGVEKAAELITSGRQLGATEARDLGIVDAVAEGDLLTFARLLVQDRKDKPCRRLSEMDTWPPPPDFFDKTAAAVARKARGQTSPLRALDAIKLAVELPFDAGMAREREIFAELRDSTQSKALRHAFFAERAVAKVPGLEGAQARPLEALAVIGGGTMGGGISTSALMAGLPVTMIERDADSLARGQANVAKNLEGFVSRGRLSPEQKAGHLDRFSGSTDIAALADADLVIEAAFEDMAVKKEVFAQLDKVMKPGAVLATNTSYLDVDEIAAVTGRPADVLGMHFFSPAQLMRLLEVVRGDKTAPDVVATAFALAKRMKKIGVLSGVCDGFIGNRMLSRWRRQADYIIEDGALPWEVDQAMEAFGMAMGPFRVMDLAGLDIGWANRKRLAPTRDPRQRYSAVPDRICEQGWNGQKTGCGFYLYEAGAAKPQPNPAAEAIILEESAKRGIARRSFTAEEIQQRLILAMINEGAEILREGIAQRPLDIDIVKIHGYGFPRWRGGPMFYADTLGLDAVLAGIRSFAEGDAYAWQAAPLLAELVAERKNFGDLN